MTQAPLPPPEWQYRIGEFPRELDYEVAYLASSVASREAIERLLGPTWGWTDKVVLDFGCGSCHTLRAFLDIAPFADFWGTDIDTRAIEWARPSFTPPLSLTTNDVVPPLEFPSNKFDVVFALSVFTHISTHWAGWLAEMHRIIRPGGLFIATFMGEGMSMGVAGEEWDERWFGMNVYEAGQEWELGGPMVLHSPWWIREHWGRLFKIEKILPRGFWGGHVAAGKHDHGVVLASKDERHASTAELEELDASDPRE